LYNVHFYFEHNSKNKGVCVAQCYYDGMLKNSVCKSISAKIMILYDLWYSR